MVGEKVERAVAKDGPFQLGRRSRKIRFGNLHKCIILQNKERADLPGRISIFCWMGSSVCGSLVEAHRLLFLINGDKPPADVDADTVLQLDALCRQWMFSTMAKDLMLPSSNLAKLLKSFGIILRNFSRQQR
ncbi:hypothetical protein C5167_018270 [Papaver somniferum]|uniref:Uncharacterized protein n=1 Tax=Papaver somniferum TaxID=3469 RepID=A0A4Y7ILT3_PAPSO|nr:hypothetical protein C5167_018270 [Papaver somniferum]